MKPVTLNLSGFITYKFLWRENMKKGIVLVFCIIFIGGLLFAGGQKDSGSSSGEKKAVKLV